MSFSASNFNTKLDSLQETQDSIVSISQWVLFHHRNSKEISELWSQFVLQKRINSQKKLSLLYLCNDVVQQAKHKRKPDFIASFAVVLPRVLGVIYPSLDGGIQAKVVRVVNVWDDRAVFNKKDLSRMRDAMSGKTSFKAEVSGERKSTSSVKSDTNSVQSINAEIVPELRLLNYLFMNMNRLIDISQTNLNQVGIQSKTYLPSDPSVSDNLPAPNIWIDRLNELEKICQASNRNIDDIKSDRHNILTSLNNLIKSVEEGLKTDDSKKTIINGKLSSLHKTRNELKEMVNDEQGQGANGNEPEPPSFESNDSSTMSKEEHVEDRDEDDDNTVPTYEDDSDDGITPDSFPTPAQTPISKPEIELPASKRFKIRKSKSVAFADNVEVKEYDQENQTEIIKIIKSDDDQTELDDDDDEYEDGLSDDFSVHHKDVLELKHEHEQKEQDEQKEQRDPQINVQEYSVQEENGKEGGENVNNGNGSGSVLDLLSKLQ